MLPEEQDVADLLRRVQAMATQSQPDDPRLHAAAGDAQASCTRSGRSACKLEGTYHDLGAFLERVSKFPRIINVGNIKIVAREKPDVQRRR